MKKLLLSLLFAFCVFETYSQKIHLIMLADEEDGKFGLASLADEELVFRMFKSVEEELEYKLQPILLNKNNYKAKILRDTIAKIKVQQNDIIIFYYTGFGYYPETSKSLFPFFKLKDSDSRPLSLDEVANLLKKKGNVFSFVMADCRNSMQKTSPRVAPLYPSENIRKLIVKKIFLEQCGVLKVASAKKGQSVYLDEQNHSSAFTKSFCFNYEVALQKTQINEIDDLSITGFFNNIKPNISNEITQNYIFERIDCNNKLKKVALKFPSYRNAPTMTLLAQRLKALAKEQDLDKRKKVIEELESFFEIKAMIKLNRKFQNGISEQKDIAIKDYLAYYEKYNPALMFIETNISTVQRNKDYTKFLAIEINEEWE